MGQRDGSSRAGKAKEEKTRPREEATSPTKERATCGDATRHPDPRQGLRGSVPEHSPSSSPGSLHPSPFAPSKSARCRALGGKMPRLGFALLFAWLAVANLGAAFPHDALKKGCSLFKYHFLEPQEMKAMQKMKEHFEGITLQPDRRCNTKLFHRKWDSAELSVPDRMMLVKAELDLVTDMLGLLDDPSFTETHQRPLAFLTQAQEDLRVCLATEAPSHQPSKKLRHWLQKLEIAKKTETTDCLKPSAILHLFQVLHDLSAAGREA